MLDRIVCICMLILLQIYVIWKWLNSCVIKMQLDGLLYTGVLPKVCRISGCYFVGHFKLKKATCISAYASLSTITLLWAFQYMFMDVTENFRILYKSEESFVSDNTIKETYPLILNLLYNMCLVTTQSKGRN
jgi:hypothetical protein